VKGRIKLFSDKYFQKRTFWILLIIYLISVIIRLYRLQDAAIYADEITWMVRGKEIIYALIHHNFDYFKYAWWNKLDDTEAIGLPLTFLSGISFVIFTGAGKFSLGLFNDIFAARLPGVLVSSLTPVAIYFYGSKLFSPKTSLIAALIYSLNPISIGLDRWVVHDSYLTLFTFVALISYLHYAKKGTVNILPGICLALAFLTKPNGLLPLFGWVTYVLFVDKSKTSIKIFILNLLTFFLTVTLLWPSSWSKPILSIFEYLIRQLSLVQGGMDVFYRGVLSKNPSPDYYLFMYLIRMPTVLLLGFIFSLVNGFIILKKIKINKIYYLLPILGFNFLFLLLISFSSKKLGIRYSLPILPWFSLLSATGLLRLFNKLKYRYLQLGSITIFVIGISLPLTYSPDFYLFYNSLAGGPKGARNLDMVGFCASSKYAVDFLNQERLNGSIYVAGCADPVRYYTADPVTYDYLNADYIIEETYIEQQKPDDIVLKYLNNLKPLKEFDKNGAVVARLFRGRQ
jgi:4-amino-4-deoxy-L-arabinose transferase-like glycosyltransferase